MPSTHDTTILLYVRTYVCMHACKLTCKYMIYIYVCKYVFVSRLNKSHPPCQLDLCVSYGYNLFKQADFCSRRVTWLKTTSATTRNPLR